MASSGASFPVPVHDLRADYLARFWWCCNQEFRAAARAAGSGKRRRLFELEEVELRRIEAALALANLSRHPLVSRNRTVHENIYR